MPGSNIVDIYGDLIISGIFFEQNNAFTGSTSRHARVSGDLFLD